MIATTRSVVSVNEPVVFVALELGKQTWKLGLTSGLSVPPWVQTVPSGDWRRSSSGWRRRAAVCAAGDGASAVLLRGGARWLLDSSRADGAGDRESGRRLVEHRSESPAAAGEVGSAGCAEAGALAGAGVRGRSAGVVRGAGAVGGGRSGAASEPRADGVDAGADAAAESDRQLAGDGGLCGVGARAAAGGVVDDGARLGGRAVAGAGAGADRRARRRAWHWWPSRSRRWTAQQAARDARGGRRAVRTAGWCACAAWRRPVRRCCSRRGWSGGRSRIGGSSAGCSGLRR